MASKRLRGLLNVNYSVIDLFQYLLYHIFIVYFQNGDLCISILHSPVDDPQSGELPCERWNPTQNVR